MADEWTVADWNDDQAEPEAAPATKPCPMCGGRGKVTDAVPGLTCMGCGGSGVVPNTEAAPATKPCPECSGVGKTGLLGNRCRPCLGGGWAPDTGT